MTIVLFPPVKSLEINDTLKYQPTTHRPRISINLNHPIMDRLPSAYRPEVNEDLEGFHYIVGNPKKSSMTLSERAEAFVLTIDEDSIHIEAGSKAGLLYGLDTFHQILTQTAESDLPCLTVSDYPTLGKRGIMLDISRGKVYTLDYLKEIVDLLSHLRYNVLQLYTEHTFAFSSHPEISEGSSPMTAEEITELQTYCQSRYIELQANFQSLGHMRRMLTLPKYQHLSESEMYWSLDTTSKETYQLLDELYGEYLPLFDSEWVNVCSDEPYDLGEGKSRSANKEVGQLYFDHLLKLHSLAKKYGKRIMLFGDVVKEHPEYADQMPRDIRYIDWIYDPKDTYGTPRLFEKSGVPYWVSPGTGNWNTLFPRFHGSLTNIANLTLEGIAHQAEGMLLTDWNDHGGYTQPAPVYYSYAYAAAVAWLGEKPVLADVSQWIDRTLQLPTYSDVVFKLAEIYQLPPIWSKNRSECVMALFDEPVLGKAVGGSLPPTELKAYDLSLPEGVEPEWERHSQHPLRPYFAIPVEVTEKIAHIIRDVQPLVEEMTEGKIKRQFLYILEAFDLMVDKLAFSRDLLSRFEGQQIHVEDLLEFEDAADQIIRRFTDLQLSYSARWFEISKHAEIHQSLSYFSAIIARYGYLKEWLSIQRELLAEQDVDRRFTTYQTGGYTTLPTY